MPRRLLIGLVVDDFRNPFFAGLASAVESAAAARGCSVWSASCEDDPWVQVERARDMLARGVDALVLTIPHAEIADAKVPLICIDRPPHGSAYVATDGVEGGRLVANHIVQMGYRTPACLLAEGDLQSVADRLTGFRLGLQGLGVELETTRIVDCGAFDFDAARDAATELVEQGADAVFAINDVLAIGALSALPDMELRAGVDVGVAGFDDGPFAALPSLDLTSVNQSTQDLGVQAVEMVVRALAEPDAHLSPVSLRPRLVVRGSTRRGR